MGKLKKEKSILGQISVLSHRLVLVLVVPIIISLVLMLVYAWKYHSSILRMETITSLKNVVSVQIPGTVWNIVSGRETFAGSNIYVTISSVEETIETISSQTGEENRLSLIVAERTMGTLENYVDRIRDNFEAQLPVVQSEEQLEEVRDVANLVASMLEEYISGEITSTARMSVSMRIIVICTAAFEVLTVIVALIIRNRAVRTTALSVRQPIERLEEAAKSIAGGSLEGRIA
ncbi:MAG: hypothetical protein IKN35_06720, partial [Lachnospiraceae bacterium]|nr:hypothetical protein [Lachnospiraceae bacterium]